MRELENTMHRAVLLAHGDEIDLRRDHAVTGEGMDPGLPDPGLLEHDRGAPNRHSRLPPHASPAAAGIGDRITGRRRRLGRRRHRKPGRSYGGRRRSGISSSIPCPHCLGNRTHAANILGISIRTLRNKVKQYTDEGYNVPSPSDRVAG
ncbi:MAG: helix-turn-helix domain-containing protein [Thalassobaculum sp.]